jgi:phospholipase/carboxylesterase
MLIINKQKNPRMLVVWFHGLGADGNDFAAVAKGLGLSDIEFILPNAPMIPITLNQGLEMRGWYDIKSLSFEHHDIAGMQKSMVYIEEIISQRIKKCSDSIKICLVGFSQGAALALFLGLRTAIKLDGVIALSGYLPCINEDIILPKTPILAVHGLHDDIISINYAKQSFCDLMPLSNFQFLTFQMGHEVIEEEIMHIKQFLQRL